MNFKPRELIVMDNTRHPEGSMVVDHYDDNGNLLAYPLGGGFELTIGAGSWTRDVVEKGGGVWD